MATATYNEMVQTAQATAAGQAITHVVIRTTLTGTGRLLDSVPLTAAALTLGQRYEWAADEIVLTLPAGDWLADGALFVLERLLSSTDGVDVYLSQHTANPGTNGANEATYGGYARTLLDNANWTLAA